MQEMERAAKSEEDAGATVWVQRDGYRMRWRHSYGGMVAEAEVQYADVC